MDEDEITDTVSTDEKLDDVQTTEEKEPLDSDPMVDNTQQPTPDERSSIDEIQDNSVG